MRRRVAILAVILVLAPTIASAGAHTGRCRRLGKQIVQYDEVAERARSRGDEVWLASTEAHISQLRGKMHSLCPQLKPSKAQQLKAFTRMMARAAAKGARKYFTGGWW